MKSKIRRGFEILLPCVAKLLGFIGFAIAITAAFFIVLPLAVIVEGTKED